MWRAPCGASAEPGSLRNEELVPLRIFADHKGLKDSDSFCIKAKGHRVDVQVRASDTTHDIQITVADLDCDLTDVNPGYQHRLAMEALNKYGAVHGHGPFRRDGSEIDNPIQVYSREDRLAACHRGLIRALARKAYHDGSGCSLIVYARGYRMQTIDGEFGSLVNSAAFAMRLPNFDHIYVVEAGDGFFVDIDPRKVSLS